MHTIKEPGADQPPSRRLKRYWRVAVLANIKDEKMFLPPGVPPTLTPILTISKQ